jgi:glutathione S-transferase
VRDEAALAGARDAIARYCEEREKELAHERWLCGDFSVADIAHFVFLNAAATLGAPLRPEHTALARWFERAAARPAVAQEVAETRAFVAKLFTPPDQGSR